MLATFTKRHQTQQQTKLDSLNYKLTHNIKSGSESFYAHVRSKQNVRDNL